MSLKFRCKLPDLSFILLFFLLVLSPFVRGEDQKKASKEASSFIGKQIQYFVDQEQQVTLETLESVAFMQSEEPVLNLGFNHNPIWLKLQLSSSGLTRKKLLDYAFPLADSLWVYEWQQGEAVELYKTGGDYPAETKVIDHQHYLFPLQFARGEEAKKVVYIKLKSRGQLIIPVSLDTYNQSISKLTATDYFKGIFYGIFLAMIFYNLFISIFIKDKSYYFYVAYIFFIAISQSLLDGYFQRYIIGDGSYLTHVLVILAPSLAGIFALYFAQVFLQVKEYSRGLNMGIRAIQAFYLAIALLSFFPNLNFLYRLVDIAALLVSVYSLVFSSIIARTGNRPAKFFLIAFTTLLLSLVIFVFRNVGILPYGFFTNNVLQLGFAVQVLLLSIALADRINILRKEKEASQEQALQAARENEELIKKQNIMLEQRVQERTLELEESNEELQVTLDNLKETQTQLVDAEKMASLGQLTAGIAHEINNPINFVTSNITPLRRDLEDVYEILDAYSGIDVAQFEAQFKQAKEKEEELEYDYLKTEINSLVDGINDGANRTSEIVKGLRTFSRLDEDVVKLAGLHENLESTLVLLNNKVKDTIEIVKEFDSSIAEIECYPGKLNQVFMNILNNAIYAVEHKNYADGEKPVLKLKTQREGSEVAITISDNGIGMSPDTQKKIFDPFFTTKDVGEGTGLGMSIVFKILQKHNGNLSMNSQLGEGTEFIIHLPISQPSEF